MTSRDHALRLRGELGRWPTPTEVANAAGIAKSSAWETIARLKRDDGLPALPAPLPVERITHSMLPKRELLTSQYDGALHHASYPSATVTLCGLDVKVEQRGMNLPPDCPICETTAKEFDRIDKSAPEHWAAYTVAPVEKDAA